MKKIILILPVILLLCSSSVAQKSKTMTPGNFAHTVYFWLKNPDNQSDREAFETSLKKFIHQSIFIKTKHIGVPASTSRDVIDNSYTYSLLLTFANKDDQDKYQEEPAHQIFIAESSSLWKKVVVYDSENILK